MSILTTLPVILRNVTSWVQPRFFTFLAATPLACKVYTFAMQHFTFLQYATVFVFGTKELTFDRIQALKHPPANGKEYALHAFHREHGTLFTLSGIVGIVAAIAQSVLLQQVAMGLFNCGNVLALLYYGEVLQRSTDPVERRSAAFGLISNLGYILATAAFVLALPEIVALLLGFLALTCGGIKIIHDAYYLIKGAI